MKLVQAFIIAFAMYSKIPMPKADWSKENMEYAICFFPLIGAVIGSAFTAVFFVCDFLRFGDLLKTMLLVSVPIVLTGGIHVDGFIDTMDARSSYAEKERKLEILKDSHIGAFAVIGSVLYFILNIGFASEITKGLLPIISLGFVFSRACSGFSVVSFKGAKRDGMLATFSNKASKKPVKLVMVLYLVLVIGAMLIINPVVGSFCVLAGFLCFFYYRWFAYKEFGGTTGDLAGYFLQICELIMLITAVIIQAIIQLYGF